MSLERMEKLTAEKRELIVSAGIRAFSRSSYKDVSTDAVTRECGISKGLLFHYFGSKQAYYLYCLERSMERLTSETGEVEGEDFYEILFAAMDRKMRVCQQHRDETLMVNMASRDASGEIARQKEELIRGYMSAVQADSARTLRRALAAMGLRDEDKRRAAEGMQIYITALMNRYLLTYQQTPDRFFADGDRIKAEMKEYLDLMLFGICPREEP